MSFSRPQTKNESDVLEDSALDEPLMYRVLLLNDNYTSMEFVVLILESIFHKNSAEAQEVMLAVHKKGAGTAGIFTKEVAETKVALVHHLARQNDFPLKCIMEPE